MTAIRTLVAVILFAGTILGVSPSPATAQVEDPFAIRVESNLVLVNAEVYDKRHMHELTPADRECLAENARKISALPPSEPFLGQNCFRAGGIKDLSPGDFHLFEDGIEQKIERIKAERGGSIMVRDNLGMHREWSNTPGGKWSTIDFRLLVPIYNNGAHFQIAYIPSNPEKGKCRHLKITVGRPYAVVFAKDQYCYTEHPASDPLDGTMFGAQMERDLDSEKRGKLPVLLGTGIFYTDNKRARVDIVLEFPWDHLKHEWKGLDLHAMIGVFGAVYRKDHTLATRFSDLACCASGSRSFILTSGGDFADPYYTDPVVLPSRYETQIDLPPGEYTLQVVVSDGKKFGRVVTPLVVENYDAEQLSISSLFLSKRFRDSGAAAQEAAAVNLAPRYVPLVSRGVQVTPAADANFKNDEPLIAYYEIYEALLDQEPQTTVDVHMRIVDARTGALKVAFPTLDGAPYQRQGKTTIALGDELKIGQLAKGDYRLEVQATDSAGRSTPWRAAAFTIKKP